MLAFTSEPDEELASLARRLCDRHSGVGADGVVYYRPVCGGGPAHVAARIFNADGSEAEMSGNGVRCLAALLEHEDKLSEGRVRVETAAGPRILAFEGREGGVATFECDMGLPILDPARIPARIGSGPGPVTAFPLQVGADTVEVTLSSLGNPHCSTFWPDLAGAPFDRLGPALERHTVFPNRANVEFIQVLDRRRIRVRFWERGVGPTLASGTGSCAAALAALLLGRVESPVTVETERGALRVTRAPDGRLALTGPAELICTGTVWPDGGSGPG